MPKYYEDSATNPDYRVSWGGPEKHRVYTAWFKGGEGWEVIGCFAEGSNDERKAAAKQAWAEHWQTNKAAE